MKRVNEGAKKQNKKAKREQKAVGDIDIKR